MRIARPVRCRRRAPGSRPASVKRPATTSAATRQVATRVVEHVEHRCAGGHMRGRSSRHLQHRPAAAGTLRAVPCARAVDDVGVLHQRRFVRDGKAGASDAQSLECLEDDARRFASTLASGSSSSRIGRSSRNARASESRWRWPPERLAPSSPSGVSRPCPAIRARSRRGPRSAAPPRYAASSACRRRAVSACRSVPENRCRSCVITANCARNERTRVVGERPAVETHGAGGGIEQPDEQADERALAGAARPTSTVSAPGSSGMLTPRSTGGRDPPSVG